MNILYALRIGFGRFLRQPKCLNPYPLKDNDSNILAAIRLYAYRMSICIVCHEAKRGKCRHPNRLFKAIVFCEPLKTKNDLRHSGNG